MNDECQHSPEHSDTIFLAEYANFYDISAETRNLPGCLAHPYTKKKHII